jgi:two-component system, OmpR family, KDP operon response regulator KdpE
MSLGRILVVDSEAKQSRLVHRVLAAYDYEALAAYNSDQVLKMVVVEEPDLLILEVELAGGIDGFDLIRQIREFSDIPIIILSTRNGEEDLLQGFNAGADDYIEKPFVVKELIARIQAILKRARMKAVADTEKEIVCGNLRINLLRRTAIRDGQEIYLTSTEFRLLRELALHKNQVMLHEQLLVKVWGPKYQNEMDYLRSYIHFLRKKLEPDSADSKIIIGIPGVGYMLTEPDSGSDGNNKKQ